MMYGIAACTLLLFAGSVLSIKERPLPGGCDREFAARSIDTAEILRQLNSGELRSGEESVTTKRDVPVLFCEKGPRNVEHSLPDTWFVPRIYKYSCDGLKCENALCSNKSVEWKTECVHVFKLINGNWAYQGQQVQLYQSATSCACKTCRDMSTREECHSAKKCPESAFPDNFCYWTPYLTHDDTGLGDPEFSTLGNTDPGTTIDPFSGSCSCCTPKECPGNLIFHPTTCSCICRMDCPPGQVLDLVNCKCHCPRGTYLGANGDCIGECSLMDLRTCAAIKCADNPELNCFVDGNRRCQCPSCDSVPEGSLDCTRTRCLEHKSKPYCKVDPCSGHCRCPNCEEQPDPSWCSNTFCGPDYAQQCRWDKKYNKCDCGKYY